ncbi:MAG: hypothetical protein KDK48_01335, partial [Chlamydiia bacterium]|nr:hypothetical protein [Chlamydiia bacterium]
MAASQLPLFAQLNQFREELFHTSHDPLNRSKTSKTAAFFAHKAVTVISLPANAAAAAVSGATAVALGATLGAAKVAIIVLTLGEVGFGINTGCAYFATCSAMGTFHTFLNITEILQDGWMIASVPIHCGAVILSALYIDRLASVLFFGVWAVVRSPYDIIVYLFATETPFDKTTPKTTHTAEDLFAGADLPDPRMLFHIHGDMFGSGSKLEGNQPEKTFGYLVSFLKKRCYNLIDKNLMCQLEDAYALSISKRFVEDAVKVVNDAFNEGRSVIIPGGWLGAPAGHAVNYELILEKEGTCTFRFYNLGAGVNHFEHEIDGTKEKAPAYTEWRGIAKEKMTDPLVFQALGEMIGFVPEALGQKYNEADLFGRLKVLLEPKEECAGKKAPKMSKQQSGICSWRSLMAIMRSHLSQEQYKRFILEIKIQSLKDHASLLTDANWVKLHRIDRHKEENLIIKSAAKLARSLAKAKDAGVVDEAYAKAQKDDLEKLLSTMKTREKKTESPFEKPSFAENDVPVSEGPLYTAPTSLDDKTKETDAAGSNTWTKSYCSMKKVDLSSAEALLKGSKELIELCKKAESKKDYEQMHLGLIDALKPLDFELAKSNSYTEKQAQELISNLGELSTLFLRSCYGIVDADKTHTDQYVLQLKLMTMQALLSKKAGFQFTCRYSLTHSLMTRIYDPQMREQHEKIYYKDQGKGIDVRYGKCSSDDGLFTKSFTMDDDELNTMEALETFLKTHYAEEFRKIRESIPGYDQMEKCEKFCRMFYSPEVPAWIRALNESSLNLKHVLFAPIVQTASPTLK